MTPRHVIPSRQSSCGSSSQRGVTLVELMVGLLVGLLIIAFVGAAFIGQSSANRSNDDSSRLQESGRIAMGSLARALRYAGYVPKSDNTIPDSFCAVTSATTPDSSGAPFVGPFVEGTDGTGHLNNSDTLTYRMWGSGSDAEPNGDGGIRDCQGSSVPSRAAKSEQSTNTLFVGTDADGEPALFCRIRTSTLPGYTAQALIPGIESFQVLYVLWDSTASPPGPTRIVSAGNVTDWTKVVAVRLSIMVRGDAGSRPDNDTQTVDMFDATYTTNAGSDTGATFNPATVVPGILQKRLRRVFTTTIELRNSPATTC